MTSSIQSSSNQIRPNNNRIYGLDILRAGAIILVLITHSTNILAPWVSWVNSLTVCGYMGVELFFVLSGFLIGQILLTLFSTTQPPSWAEIRHFWIRRWFRTLPNYLLVLGIIVLLTSQLGHHKPDWRYLFFLQNFITPHPPAFGEAWSLAVEEWFYLSTPILFLLTARIFPTASPKLNTLKSILFVITLGLALRILRASESPLEWDGEMRKIVLFRPDAIMYGVIWAWVKKWNQALMIRHKRSLAVLGACITGTCTMYFFFFCSMLDNSFFAQTFFFSLTSLGLCLFLPLAETIRHPGTFLAKIIVHISRTSYSIYLLHFSIILVLFQRFFPPPNLSIAMYIFILYWGLSLTAPTVLYYTFEEPILNLRDRICPSKADLQHRVIPAFMRNS